MKYFRSDLICLLYTLVGLIAATEAQADDLINRYFNGLRGRGLYLIAEDYAVAQLADQQLLPDERARYTSELVKTLVAHGGFSPPEQREELWTEAETRLNSFIKSSPQNPRRLELAALQAMLPSRFGQTLAWEADVNPADTGKRLRAMEYFGTAIPQLTEQVERLEQAPVPTRSQLADGQLSEDEIDDLRQQVQLSLGQATFYQAMLTESGPERASRLLSAAERLSQLYQQHPESKWTEKAGLFGAKLSRRQGDYRKALVQLQSIARTADNYGLQDDVLAEQARTLYRQGKIDEGLTLITDRIQTGEPLSDELRAVAVEGLLQAWKLAGEKGNVDLQKDLLAEAEYHHDRIGGKWRMLTHYRLQQVQQDRELGGELARVVRDAQWNYQQGDLERAIELFSEAAARANAEQLPEKAVEFAFTQGSIQIQQQQWQPAASTFHAIVSTFPKQPRAADAGIMKCYALGQQYVATPSKQTREEYESALIEHRQRFPDTASFAEATWMLATHQEQRLQWTDAIDLYREIPPVHQRYDSATLRILILYEKILDRLRSLGGDLATWEDNVVNEIIRIDENLPETNVLESMPQCQIALHIAQLALQHSDRMYVVADVWLQRVHETVNAQRTIAQQTGQQMDPLLLQIERAAQQLRIVSLAGQERLDAARQLMLQQGETDAEVMLSILMGLTELTSRVNPNRQRELGNLQMEAVKKLLNNRNQLSEQQQRMLAQSHAEAYIATGNLPEAAAIYESLIEQSPRSQRLIKKVIDVLLTRGQSTDLDRAHEWYTRLERLQKTGSVEWLKTRLDIARLASKRDRPEESQKIINVTQALYPQLGTPELKNEYEAFAQTLVED